MDITNYFDSLGRASARLENAYAERREAERAEGYEQAVEVNKEAREIAEAPEMNILGLVKRITKAGKTAVNVRYDWEKLDPIIEKMKAQGARYPAIAKALQINLESMKSHLAKRRGVA